MPPEATDRAVWPLSGPHRKLLELFDQLREAADRPSLEQIVHGMTIDSRTALNDILRGKRLPADDRQTIEIIRSLNGSRAAELRGQRLYLRARALAPRRRRQPGPDRVPAQRDGTSPVTNPVPEQLLGPIGGFVGRSGYMRELDAWLTGPRTTLLVCSVDGMAGIGKTTLVRQWADGAKADFPDGQLYINLRGFDPTGEPLTSFEALGILLEPLIDAVQLPDSLEERIGKYRTEVAGTRRLIVLDNALDEAQVRPLLPGVTSCATIITSRNTLFGLEITESARRVAVGLMTTQESRALLENKLGPARVSKNSVAIDRIIASCGRLPLALSIVGSAAAPRSALSLTTVADELEQRLAQGDLSSFEVGGDPHGHLAAVFSWSYDKLSAPAQQAFRLLGLNPALDFAEASAASLMGCDRRAMRRLLRDLVTANLIEQLTGGRFRMHDLLGAYALKRTNEDDGQAERDAAQDRLVAYYLHSAHAGALQLYPLTTPIELGPAPAGVAVEEFANYTQAFDWFDQEREVLPKIVDLAAQRPRPDSAWMLAWTCQDYYRRRGLWHDWASTSRTALRAARATHDRVGIARTRDGLGRALMWLSEFDEAQFELRASLRLFKQLHDQEGVAHAYIDLGTMYELRDDIRAALRNAEKSLAIARETRFDLSLAKALNNTGWYYVQLDQPAKGLRYCVEGLNLHRRIGNRRGEYNTLDSIGLAYHEMGDYAQARRHFDEALSLHTHMHDRWAHAMTLMHLGDLESAAHDGAAALNWYEQSRAIFEELGHKNAGEVKLKVEELEQRIRNRDGGF